MTPPRMDIGASQVIASLCAIRPYREPEIFSMSDPGHGKGHKRTLIACARKLLIFINTIVARGIPWQDKPPARVLAASQSAA